MSIKKVVIPVAGEGSRFSPVTKTIPKEMLPVLNKPILHYIVEECIAAGIRDIIFVTRPGKEAIVNYFDDAFNDQANFIYIRQKEFYGTGYSLLAVKDLVQDEPFALAWGDDIFLSRKPALSQLIATYNKYQAPVFMLLPTDDEGTRRFGIVEGEEVRKGIFKIKKFIEKPGPKKIKSRLASLGRYILTPDIFPKLELAKKNLKKNQEFYFNEEPVRELIKERPVYGQLVKAEFVECGIPLAWLKSNILMGLKHRAYKKELRKFLVSLV